MFFRLSEKEFYRDNLKTGQQTPGVTNDPYFTNSVKLMFIPLERRMFIYTNPARDPTGLRFIPRFEPIVVIRIAGKRFLQAAKTVFLNERDRNRDVV